MIYEAYEACWSKTATAEQKRLVRGVEDRAVHEDWDRQHQSSHDRIDGRGYVWDGWRLAPDIIGEHGISLKFDVGGYLHDPIVKEGLFSRKSGSPLMLRCLTMTSKPKRAVEAEPCKGYRGSGCHWPENRHDKRLLPPAASKARRHGQPALVFQRQLYRCVPVGPRSRLGIRSAFICLAPERSGRRPAGLHAERVRLRL
jgi:hypothetical protein